MVIAVSPLLGLPAYVFYVLLEFCIGKFFRESINSYTRLETLYRGSGESDDGMLKSDQVRDQETRLI